MNDERRDDQLLALQARWPQAGWQPSYLGDDVLIGIVQGAPILAWRPEGARHWRSNTHHGVQVGMAEAGSAVAAVERWVRVAEELERGLVRRSSPPPQALKESRDA